MHQTKKGKQWYFGMKLHIGVDSQSGLVHSAVVTAANVHDKHQLPDLLHGERGGCMATVPIQSQKELISGKAPHAKDFTNKRVRNRRGEVRRGDAGEEPQQVAHPRPRRTRLLRRQAAVGLCQGALSRAGEERHPCLHGAGAWPTSTSTDHG